MEEENDDILCIESDNGDALGELDPKSFKLFQKAIKSHNILNFDNVDELEPVKAFTDSQVHHTLFGSTLASTVPYQYGNLSTNK